MTLIVKYVIPTALEVCPLVRFAPFHSKGGVLRESKVLLRKLLMRFEIVIYLYFEVLHIYLFAYEAL